jgi:hypothetical protein
VRSALTGYITRKLKGAIPLPAAHLSSFQEKTKQRRFSVVVLYAATNITL